MPTRNKPMAISVVPIGLRMNGQEKFIGYSPGASRAGRGGSAGERRARSRSM